MFLIAGFFNGTAGILGLGFPAFGVKFTTGLQAQEPAVLFIFSILGFIVALFGLGYLLVAYNPPANRGLVVIGMIAKVTLFGFTLYGYLNGLATLAFMVVVSSDIVWVGLFAFYLCSTNRSAKSIYA